jgi:(1->4)-alpha-D-glucan 1-alpha-D-glucosylmutase
MERTEVGLPKLWLVHQSLQLRGERPEAFGAKAAYVPVKAQGPQADRVIAFLRGDGVMTIAQRWAKGTRDSSEGWGDTVVEVPEGSWENRLTGRKVSGGQVRVAELLAAFPAALLARS